jgi:hypothetical protein
VNVLIAALTDVSALKTLCFVVFSQGIRPEVTQNFIMISDAIYSLILLCVCPKVFKFKSVY